MSIERWRGRTALVTGASSGIGDAIARHLSVALGMRVAVMARREHRLTALVRALKAQGGQVLACTGDVTVAADIDACFAEIEAHFGGLDLLVNNAGVATMGPLADGRPHDWQTTLNVNVTGPALCTQSALQAMAGRDEGQIINISSIYAHRDQVPNFAFYHASKAALKSLTNTLRSELAETGTRVRVGMISPGMVATEFRARATDGRFSYESYFRDYEPILPEDVVQAVVYMLSTRPHVQVQDILLSPLGQGI